MIDDNQTEDIVAKYKRLLSLARTSLEANQATLAAKDQHISNLLIALEEEKLKAHKRAPQREDELSHVPRRILCRVDIDDNIWILLEYDDCDDVWRVFTDEQSMNDYIQRIPGVPLSCPPKSLSAQESHRIEEESNRKVERIVEEFRRFKVRTEIARKQKDAENKQALNGSTGSNHSGNFSSMFATPDKAFGAEALAAVDEVHRLKAQLEEQEVRWRHACEKLAKENESLRNVGGEALLAAQWRGRYESCLREKEALIERLKSLTSYTDSLNALGKSPEQAYMELQDEFAEFRRRVAVIEKARRALANSAGDGAAQCKESEELLSLVEEYDLEDSILRHETATRSKANSSAASTTTGSSGGQGGSGMTEAKIQYVRHMVVQYLSCREPEVKVHIESALVALFRLTAGERAAIDDRRREETQDTLSSLSSFLGSLSAVST